MRLEGIHHITCMTADAPRNVEFYAGLLGLRLVKKSVNQDDPSVYHLFYADEAGSPGADLTFFEFKGIPQGRPGDGMIHTIGWRVASSKALDFWAARLRGAGYEVRREETTLRFADYEGLEHELRVSETEDPPLIAEHPEIPAELALQGFDGVRAYASRPEAAAPLLEALGFEAAGDGWEARGERRGGLYAYDPPPERRGLQGAGTVHHIAWASRDQDHEAWLPRIMEAGAHPTGVIDRFWFRSIYFREPSGVLFELATFSPGFAVDEDPEHLGETLVLPPWLERHREAIEAQLTPLVNPRS